MKFVRITAVLIFLLAFYIVHAQEKNKLAAPELKDGKYSIALKNAVIEVDPSKGARIISLQLDGKNFLTGPAINPTYWGSSFWLSPQKVWNNFSHTLDNMPYSVSVKNNVIILKSQKDSLTGLIFSKEISGNPETNFFSIRYSISNASAEMHSIAPWEVTRVNVNGLAFFPRGEGERWGSMAAMAEDIDGITWFKHDTAKIPSRHLKLFSDGREGWVAQVNKDLIFIKKFPDIPFQKAAPSEAEVEIYTNQDRSYVEIEEQGAYQALEAGASMSWEVSWFLGKLPPDIPPTKGNPELLKYVRKIIKAGHF